MSRQPSLYPAEGIHVRVAVNAPVEEAYVYAVPPGMADWIVAGCRVRLRFSGRAMTGVVEEVLDAAPPELDPRRIRPIEDCLDYEPVLPPAVTRLARSIAAGYLVGLGEALALCLPPGGDQVGGRRVRWCGGGAAAPTDCAGVVERLRASGGNWTEVRRLEAGAVGTGLHAALFRLRDAGLVELLLEGDGGEPGARQIAVRWNTDLSLEAARDRTRRGSKQRAVLEAVRPLTERPQPLAQLARTLEVSRGVIEGLADKGVLDRVEMLPESDPAAVLPADGAGTFDLNADQTGALNMLSALLESRAPGPLLLHGVTGSGKTEVYLRAALKALERGRGVILLVPEIGLTPQLEQRARAVFGDQVVVLHSGMATGARARAWWRLRSRQARVVVGPRSAVLSPMPDVGLIVVDEEQDSAYKQGERPRYHGREIALWRARLEDAAIVLGSATPAVESYAAAESGRWQLASLPQRVALRPMPETRLVDMRAEWREAGRDLVSRDLEAALEKRLQAGEQALVMLNRRGFASAIVCRACGDRGECPQCAVSLTYHRAEGVLRCHYCDHRAPVPRLCGVCGADMLQDFGHGTQRLQEGLMQRFADARIERFDADQTQRRGAHGKILARFGRGEIDILVGTQMLAKGHDFPAVTLVGVVGADASLGVPDFRAAERTFQLLTQVSGRAGRGERPGEVILQAHQPGHYAIETAMQHDYEAFYRREIRFRERLAYPPYSSLATCVCRGKVATDVKQDADRLAATLRRHGGDAVRILGPASPPIGRLRGKYRLQILVKAAGRRQLPGLVGDALADLREAGTAPADLVVDIVPDSLA